MEEGRKEVGKKKKKREIGPWFNELQKVDIDGRMTVREHAALVSYLTVLSILSDPAAGCSVSKREMHI